MAEMHLPIDPNVPGRALDAAEKAYDEKQRAGGSHSEAMLAALFAAEPYLRADEDIELADLLSRTAIGYYSTTSMSNKGRWYSHVAGQLRSRAHNTTGGLD